MTWWHTHPDAVELVRKHRHDAEVFLLAGTDPCIRIRDEEVANVDRLLHGGEIGDLRGWNRPESWFVAVFLCRGDQTDALPDFVDSEGWHPDRFHFYLHMDAPRSVLRGWAEVGLPLDRVNEGIQDWGGLHRLLGLDLNVRIVEDFGGG